MRSNTPTTPGCRFDVSNVKPTTIRLPEMGVRAALERTTRTRVRICSNGEKTVLTNADFHPLIASAFLAFQQHYPLALAPDIIWVTILQGVAQHVQNHAVHLRKRLVQHDTKIELVVDLRVEPLPQEDSEMLGLTQKFLARMVPHVCPEKRFLFRKEFTTTKDVDRIASSVALMETYQIHPIRQGQR